MSMSREKRDRARRLAAVGAIALGVAAGSYGVAAAASGTDTSPSGSGTTSGAPDPQNLWGAQRSDETPLTGDTLASVKAAALEKAPNATVVRVETDADGHAAYEAHLVKQDGTPATVYVDKQFDVVSVETR
jgi:uncharacterized membrane protein YkoI